MTGVLQNSDKIKFVKHYVGKERVMTNQSEHDQWENYEEEYLLFVF